jgi:tetratricopeptide (TPR) repeat protein
VVGINRVAQALVVLGQLQQALAENDQALQTATGMAAEAPDNSEWQKGLAECQLRRAGMLRALGRVDEAQAAQQQAQAVLEALRDAPQPAA